MGITSEIKTALLSTLLDAGPEGLTTREVCETAGYSFIGRHNAGPRLWELEKKGLISKAGQRRHPVTKKYQHVWVHHRWAA